ncbi:MAG: hypothetical protein WDN23_05275 [Edaphobacter sp.]
MSETKTEPQAANPEPKLRHEFVGMMFAVAIGEVGLQTAALFQAGHFLHFLPAWTHLTVATMMIATSWVGWTLSVAPGARRDVKGIFEWEFVVLLVDVTLVILYFILVRSVDFGKGESAPRIAQAPRVALLIVIIFSLYLFWDLLTKILIFWKYRDKSKKGLFQHYNSAWWLTSGVRILPSTLCLVLAYFATRFVNNVDASHLLTADIAMIGIVLLFRALKDLSSSFPRIEPDGSLSPGDKHKRLRAACWTGACGTIVFLGLLWSALSLPLPPRLVTEISTAPSDTEHPAAASPQHLDHSPPPRQSSEHTP